ncbi:cell division protein FtsQ/DivIB [Nocardioides campestrisoli]|uniref:cell division protein FtsQ/DivIB n=1 Tax=Nocardioides campestrisoli TaxID=2736757 RepID=UPI001CD38E5F|nr:FtsQ-type POTRA domain-containing protein [Nocardioides campestrisoli]
MVRLPGRSAEPEPGERTRKRFVRRQWARRWGLWRPLLVAVLAAALLATGAWVVWSSEVLGVDRVSVEGTELLSAAQVRAAAGVEPGTPLARVDLDRVARRVETLAEVRGASVRRAWPDAVVVDVEERVAVAVVDLGTSLRGMDRDGVVFTRYERPPEDLPRVRVVGAPDNEAFREAAAVVSSLPTDLAAQVHHVDVETVDRISLALRDERVVVWGSAEQSEEKAAVLGALLQAREAKRYDVSVPGQPVTSG